ncbi:serine/threonine-protein kinase [Kitasatospora sp. NPDC002040]|uniref:serine/threonine-protein kinase n=1 Tax=Kitasatospora sp. NPDC002040 TaxID=3154661 RepID=UPI00332E616E
MTAAPLPDSAPARPPVFLPLERTDPRQVGGYRLYARLGEGGMGRVYLSYTPGGRAVALKVVRPELAEEPQFQRRFAQEVASAQRIHGLYTAQVIDSGTAGRTPWLATSYVPGPSLQQVVQQHGALPVRTVLLLLAGIAEALQAIHGVEVVHRDLKPSNVLVTGDGPRVIDFGIALATDADALTRTGIRIGSPAFMAPEQARGTEVGAATDVFALGALGAYVAGGVVPFGDGPDTAVLYRVVHEEPDLSRVPGELQELLLRCLAKQPEQRPTPAEIIEAARSHPALGGQLLFADWLPGGITAEIARRSELPPAELLSGPDDEPLSSAEAPTALIDAPAPTRLLAPAEEPATRLLTPAEEPQTAPATQAAPAGARRTGRWKAGLAAVLLLAVGGTVGGVLWVKNSGAKSGGSGPGGYAAEYTDRELLSPDGRYDFDLKLGKVIPSQGATWFLGHSSDEFYLTEDSDAFIAEEEQQPTPEQCAAGIDQQPVTALRFDDVPAGRYFCVRERSTHDLAIVRVIGTNPDGGPVEVSLGYYRHQG